MIGALARAFDGLLGRGEAAVTVPPLDGVLRPNGRLDAATTRLPLPDVSGLAVVGGQLIASAGNALHTLQPGVGWTPGRAFASDVLCLTALEDNGCAVALSSGDIVIEGGRFSGRAFRAAPDVRCITALSASGRHIFLANGSAENAPDDWQLDLLQRNATGSIWRIDLDSGDSAELASGLAFPAGLAVGAGGLVCSEAWKHRLVRIDDAGALTPLCSDLPGYPGALAVAVDGFWLAVFAPRSQLVELVLREPRYRRRMVAEVPRAFWIAPKLRAGRSFHEPLQGGGVKRLGVLKPWAPTLSAGLCIALDSAFQPRLSLHSRADGATHGVTAMVEHDGRLFVGARGDGVVVALPLDGMGDDE